MIKARENEQKSSLIWCIPIAKHFPSSFTMSLFWEKMCPLTGLRSLLFSFLLHIRGVLLQHSLPSEYTKQHG